VQSTAHANGVIERFIGSVRRECLDHVIVWNAAGLQRLLQQYVTYYQEWRTHLSLDKDAPIARRAQSVYSGAIVEVAHVGGLHHHYERCAA
jgi:transposase InsO family protein